MEHPALIIYILGAVVFGTVACMHLARTNLTLVRLYALQALVVSILLFVLGANHEERLLALVVIVAIFTLKVVIIPYLLSSLVHRTRSTFIEGAYLSVPWILLGMLVVVFVVHASLASLSGTPLALLLAGLFVAIMLVVNSKGAISQIVGILAAENCVALFAALLMLSGNVGLELGILFDTVCFVLVTSTLAGMMHKRLNTLDVSSMNRLAE